MDDVEVKCYVVDVRGWYKSSQLILRTKKKTDY